MELARPHGLRAPAVAVAGAGDGLRSRLERRSTLLGRATPTVGVAEPAQVGLDVHDVVATVGGGGASLLGLDLVLAGLLLGHYYPPICSDVDNRLSLKNIITHNLNKSNIFP